jgi:hypothetical protein
VARDFSFYSLKAVVASTRLYKTEILESVMSGRNKEKTEIAIDKTGENVLLEISQIYSISEISIRVKTETWSKKFMAGTRRGFFKILFTGLQVQLGYAVAQLVETLRYKPEGRGFDSR